MKKYLTKWVVTIEPGKPLTRANSTYTFVSLVNPTKPNGTVSFEIMMADKCIVDEWSPKCLWFDCIIDGRGKE